MSGHRAHYDTYNASKAAAAIGFLVDRTGADLYSVLKMIYLADKSHLGKFGRTITGDRYAALEKGPIPDGCYKLLKFVRGDRAHFDAMPAAREFFSVTGNAITLLQQPDLNQLSKSDQGELNLVADMYRREGWKGAFRYSHDAAWKAAWDRAQESNKGSVDMNLQAIAATLSNGPEVIEYLVDPNPGEAECPDDVAMN